MQRINQSRLSSSRFKPILLVIALVFLSVEPKFSDAGEGQSFGAIGSSTTIPEMVDVEGGRFVMGSPVDELGREASEGPQHEVSVARFQISRTEVTVGQFSAFAEATGYVPDGTCTGWDRANTNVRSG